MGGRWAARSGLTVPEKSAAVLLVDRRVERPSSGLVVATVGAVCVNRGAAEVVALGPSSGTCR